MSSKNQVPSDQERERLSVDLGPVQTGDLFAKINSGKAVKVKRRVNTHGRMKRSQAEVGKILQEIFGETYHQTPGSGSYSTFNRGKVDPEEAKALAADVRVRNMRYLVEVKSGYENVLLEDLLIPETQKGGKDSKNEMRAWIKEVQGYSAMALTPSLIFWKKPRRRIMVIATEETFQLFMSKTPGLTDSSEVPCLRFEGWCIFDVQHLLALPKEVLFNVQDTPSA